MTLANAPSGVSPFAAAMRFRDSGKNLFSSSCVYPSSVASDAVIVRSFRLLRSEKIDTFENLLTPVRNVKRCFSSAYLMTP